MTIYCIITTCLTQLNYEQRKNQYIRGITSMINRCKDIHIKIIIVENSGITSSFLDDLGCEVFYTDTNKMATSNYGIKEVNDVFKCLEKYNIQDNDHVIKMSGRYYLSDSSPFIDTIQNLKVNDYDAILKYGYWGNKKRTKHSDCFTGLICLKAKYIRQIEIQTDSLEPIEWKWAKVTLEIDDSKIKALDKLGLFIAPTSGNNNYFEV